MMVTMVIMVRDSGRVDVSRYKLIFQQAALKAVCICHRISYNTSCKYNIYHCRCAVFVEHCQCP